MADLKEREIEKLNVIKKVFIGECTKKEASDSLGLTVRQIIEKQKHIYLQTN